MQVAAAFFWLLRVGPHDAVNVDRAPPTVERLLFDPKLPPGEIDLKGESAATQYNFQCATHVKYEIVKTENVVGGQVEVTARVHVVDIKIVLTDRIFLPRNANQQLRNHEEGHREINERVYENAEAIAKAAGNAALGRDWVGRGKDEDDAGKAATDAAVAAVSSDYLKQTADVASRVGDAFDDITQHGTRVKPKVADAITQAFEKGAATQPVTQPATKAAD